MSTRAGNAGWLRTGLVAGTMAGASLWLTAGAVAQGGFGRRPETVIQNARIITMAGKPIDDGSIVIQGSSIRQIGKDVKAGDNATVIDAKGMVITPGLIDVDGSLGLTGVTGRPASATADALNRVADAFDRYNTKAFKEAVRHGVTAVYVSPRTGAGIAGVGAVIRLEPGDGPWAGKAVVEDSALCVELGSGDRPTQRLASFDRIRKQFRGALDYREAQETYKEELEEYEKKVKERAEKEAKDSKDEKKADSKDEKPADEKPRESSPSPKPSPPSPPTPPSPTPPDPNPPDPKPPGEAGAGGAAEAGGEGAGTGDEPAQPDPRPRRGPRGGPRGTGGEPPATPSGPSGAASDGESKDELKKPARPGRDPRSETILRALDREIPVRVRANRSEDILNAIDLAREFKLRLIVDGGAESYLVAPQLARAEAAVVLGLALGRDYFANDAFARRSTEVAARLEAASVAWYVGSGESGGRGGVGEDSATRFVLLNAQLTVQGSGGTSKDPLRLVTAAAADFLGVSETCGRLRTGMMADLVVWTGDPLDPATQVAMVYVGGELVYRSDEAMQATGGAGSTTPGEGGNP